jgi:hypothetical protein
MLRPMSTHELTLTHTHTHTYTTDYELFDLRDQVVALKGPETTFYSLLDLPPTATDAEIARAYRKASLALHPDKNPGVEAAALYTLLTSVFATLKERRAKYDAYLKRGWPRWRGSGYYYAKYKPGFGLITLLVLVAVSVTQYGTAWILYTLRVRDFRAERERVNHLSLAQVRKALQREGSGKLSRKAFKSSKPADLLGQTEEGLEAAFRPKPEDMVIVALPLFVYRKGAALLGVASGGAGAEPVVAEGKGDGDGDGVRKAKAA